MSATSREDTVNENRIKLAVTMTRDLTGWTATFIGPHGDEVERLFGTRTLPTVFTLQTDYLRVQRAIQALNPGVAVA